MKERLGRRGIKGRKEGASRKDGRKEGRKEGRREERKKGRTEGRKEGRQEGRKAGRQAGRKEGRKEGRPLTRGLLIVFAAVYEQHLFARIGAAYSGGSDDVAKEEVVMTWRAYKTHSASAWPQDVMIDMVIR
jgi:hypothetical protein